MDTTATLKTDAIALLKNLIAIPSFSRDEDRAALMMVQFLETRAIPLHRNQNNIWCRNRHFNPDLPTVLLNSHLDTVKPNAGWTIDPFKPLEKEGRLYGLGSNDAGGALVSLLAAFLFFYDRPDMQMNLLFAATAEEENSGVDGIEKIVPELGKIELAAVGEPTGMELAVAEKGLMVLDCTASGVAGHAARDVGENAISKAVQDIRWLQTYRFPRTSGVLGPVRMTVTMIDAGVQHNVIPDRCHFVVDVRTTDAYRNEEVLDIIRRELSSEVVPRSTRLQPSAVAPDHPAVRAAGAIGMRTFGSPTTSDQAVLRCPSVKIGPGRSERSHTADEYIYLSEIEKGIERYIQWLERLNSEMASKNL